MRSRARAWAFVVAAAAGAPAAAPAFAQAPPAADEARNAGTDVPVPKRSRFVQPEYPMAALSQGLRGIVILALTIDTTGKVSGVEVVRSLPAFDEAAVAAARQWEYEVTKVDGKAVPVRLTVPITFALKLPEMTRDPAIPELRQGVAPPFPSDARPQGTATVTANVTIDPSGQIVEAEIKTGATPWTEALLLALRTWRFTPLGGDRLATFQVRADFVPVTRGTPKVELKLSGLHEGGPAPAAAAEETGTPASAPGATPASEAPAAADDPAAPRAPGAGAAPTSETATAGAESASAEKPAEAAPPAEPAAAPTAPPSRPATPAAPSAAPPAGQRADSPPQEVPSGTRPADAPPTAPATATTADPAGARPQPAEAQPTAARSQPAAAAGAPSAPTPNGAAPATPGTPAPAPPEVEVVPAAPAPPPVVEAGVSAIPDILLGPGVPDLTKGRRPVVPPIARMNSISGNVEVRFVVEASGASSVRDVFGPELLREAARQTVGSWMFRRTTPERLPLIAVFSYITDTASASVKRPE